MTKYAYFGTKEKLVKREIEATSEAKAKAKIKKEGYRLKSIARKGAPTANKFSFEAWAGGGDMVDGEIEASSEDDARTKIRKNGIVPTQVFVSLKYNYIQFISYEVDTYPRTKYKGETDAGLQNYKSKIYKKVLIEEGSTYIGDQKPKDDIKHRCNLVEEAIDKAAGLPQISQSNKCLKVFMMPEFYFRGKTGAYTPEDTQAVIEKLRGLVQGNKWNHWLFVFGTILEVFKPLTTETSPDGKADGKWKAVYNVALVQKGNAGEEKSCVVVKDIMSGIDFTKKNETQIQSNKRFHITKTSTPDHLWHEDVDHMESDAQAEGKEKQTSNYSGLGIFSMEGITFGLEICLDHAERRLRESPPKAGENWIQIQLIPSAGMSPEVDAVVACEKGFVFNCDGEPHTFVHEVKTEFAGATDATLKTEMKPKWTKAIHTSKSAVKIFKQCFQGKAKLKLFQPKPIPQPKTM